MLKTYPVTNCRQPHNNMQQDKAANCLAFEDFNEVQPK